MEFNVHNLVKWFQINYPGVVKAMKQCDHHYSKKELNPYHLEGDVFTHTMMVVLEASKNKHNLQRYMYNQLLVAALLHDIGKPVVRKNNHEKKRVHFYSHEPLSTFFAIDILDHISKDFRINLDKRLILEAISMHTEVFKLSKEKLTDRLVGNQNLANLLMALSSADHNGRFYELGDRINEEMHVKPKPFLDPKNHVVINVGLPCSGKSTFVQSSDNDFFDYSILCRDDIVMELASLQDIETYDAAFKAVDQKEVDKIFQKRKKNLIGQGKDVMVDMTHMSRKSRRKSLQGFGDYFKTAIVHMTSLRNIEARNKNREGKNIPEDVIEKMAKSFYPPLYDEFDEIIWRFNEPYNSKNS